MLRITKIAEAVIPDFKSAEWKSFILGEENESVSLPIDYVLKGNLIHPIRVGDVMWVARTERNGVKCPGIFVSSRILSILEKDEAKIVRTRNSVYLLQEID